MQLTQLRTVRPFATVAPHQPGAERGRTPIGQILVQNGALSPGDLVKALALQARQEVQIGDILIAHDLVTDQDLYRGLSKQWGAQFVDLNFEQPDARLIDAIGAKVCLKGRFLPWKQVGIVTIICTARPAEFAEVLRNLPENFGPVRMAIASETQVFSALERVRQTYLTHSAETCVREEESCRNWHTPQKKRFAISLILFIIMGILLVPKFVISFFFGWAVLILIASSALKFAAAATQVSNFRKKETSGFRHHKSPSIARLPVVSIMVPLYKERKVASQLIRRLSKLSYPKELLDICLVVEADDHTTTQALAEADLPKWARVVTVPTGAVRTKPRALNYALDFCRGTIIGVYDAEDAPEEGQIHAVVRRFHERGQDVACLQGVLDFYNAQTNWLARCFTVEYATWFRVILPGLEKIGFAIPLGGTTLFFRREALEKLGGWDAHNVTENADLGIRLARHGYRTEVLPTVTYEEANCRYWPWIKQRSRWLKGYAITWTVHMRNPAKLLKDLGPWRFLGVQLLFLGTLSQYILAPLLWSFWLVPFIDHHPIKMILPSHAIIALGIIFFLSEILSISVGMMAVSGPRHRHLLWWVPTLHFYFPLGALASYKGIFELIVRPFYWDKTEHGLYAEKVVESSNRV
ncbi:glycosyltransferase [Falsihalocynthiibacter arcticus]|uniref:Glycosyl transferase n=1 Tax=Falsihalocynthiibacter arcticus TaxID=1579316 RepID=A0A126UVK5_9RHOB|nr:glycosyltransferase [Falsihalocynthiibacter arcticus]AML49907.1 glycosyl transferase [Falsihalocynthiibacter arcticus]